MEILHDNDGGHVVTQLAFPVATPRFQSLSFTLISMVIQLCVGIYVKVIDRSRGITLF